jgi:hypothetical protein
MSSGEAKAWEALAGLDPPDVEKNASVRFDGKSGGYVLKSFGKEFLISLKEREITGLSPVADALRTRFRYFFDISALWYLVGARDFGYTGRLLKPQSLKGGHHFFTGTHELPLGSLAGKYGSDGAAFLARARELEGKPLEYGDASCELLPLPRIPVTLILWFGDEEFPPRADILFDSTAELQAPLDIIWSLAMLSVLVML